ncbi:MAG: DUF6691 family protein [Ferruginibacter sp.]
MEQQHSPSYMPFQQVGSADIKMKIPEEAQETQTQINVPANLKYLVVGMLFGIVLVKSEVISWFRIQEMFRLQSFHMFGVIGSAVITGIISILILKRFKLNTLNGEVIAYPEKKFSKGQVIGGLIFGAGWAITGACPGPLYAQLGTGFLVTSVTILSALAGTWVYGKFQDELPH